MTAALEDIKHVDIEEWLTLNTAASPTKLKPGESPSCNNTWVDEKPGSVITANGLLKVGTIPSNNPVTFCINFFRTVAGTQTFVVSDNQKVWWTVDFQNYTLIADFSSSTSFQIRGLVIRDKLWLTNGNDPVATWDGTTFTALDGNTGNPNVPRGKYIAYHDERVWVGHTSSARSQVAFSALTDSSGTSINPDNSSAWPPSNTLQISEGDADFLTGLKVYRGYLHFFKQYTIWRLGGFDEYTYTRVKTRASTGSRFNESISELDSLLHFIGVDGIYVFDGEEAVRISDIIDPATASQTAFGFNQIQQPTTNNQFWEVAATAEWNTGTVLANQEISNELLFAAVDDSQADFQAGPTQTDIDTTSNPGSIQLSRQSSGGSAERIGQGINSYFDDSHSSPLVQYGQPTQLTDGSRSQWCGLGVTGNFTFLYFTIDLSSDQTTKYDIGRVIVRGAMSDNIAAAKIQVNTGAYQAKGATNGTWVDAGSVFNIGDNGTWTPKDVTIDFSTQNAIQVRVFISANAGSYECSEVEVYSPAFQTTGKFVSRTLDYGTAPATFGNFYADSDDIASGTHDVTYFTQSSDDGSSWDAEISVTIGSAIGSTLKRYLRWGAYFTSDGTSSSKIDSVFVGTMYISAIHDTGGNVFSWGPFESDQSLNGQAINYYYRGATTSGGVSSASWNAIVPPGVLSISTSMRYVQFRIDILGGNPSQLPIVRSVTINWVAGSATQPSTLQNVASVPWRNRYWLACAGPGASSNDTVLIRGKKTFRSPWQLKDWNILSFTRFQDSLYGGSSTDGSIYILDTGYSINGEAMDSYFETGDFSVAGFNFNPKEVLLEVERMGSYNLTFSFSINQGNTWTDYSVDLTASTFAPSYWKRINLDTQNAARIRFRVRTNGVDQPFQVHNLIFYYSLESVRGSIQ